MKPIRLRALDYHRSPEHARRVPSHNSQRITCGLDSLKRDNRHPRLSKHCPSCLCDMRACIPSYDMLIKCCFCYRHSLGVAYSQTSLGKKESTQDERFDAAAEGDRALDYHCAWCCSRIDRLLRYFFHGVDRSC